MRITTLLLFAVAISIPCNCELPSRAKRDDALSQLNNCLKRNVPGHHWTWRDDRACKNNNRNVQVLVDVYKAGDKSVLPTLFHFTYLTDFYDEALLSDPEAFLGAMNQLSEIEKRQVADGLAGNMLWIRSREQFERIRSLLRSVPETAATSNTAKTCLDALETRNAALLVNYFPPQTFTSRAADYEIHWYSRELYAVHQPALWQRTSTDPTTYRFTVIGGMGTGATISTLVLNNDGTGLVRITGVDPSNFKNKVDSKTLITKEQVATFFSALIQADYWKMPTEGGHRGFDGAVWILEGAEGERYHVVVRWCPGIETQDAPERTFANAAKLLFEFAGHKYDHGC